MPAVSPVASEATLTMDQKGPAAETSTICADESITGVYLYGKSTSDHMSNIIQANCPITYKSCQKQARVQQLLQQLEAVLKVVPVPGHAVTVPASAAWTRSLQLFLKSHEELEA